MAISFTEDQQKVIDARHTNVLVSAAAGSGKTAVLVERKICERKVFHINSTFRLQIVRFFDSTSFRSE